MRNFILFVFFLFWTTLVLAQAEEFAFSRIDIYNGLSHNQVNTILKGKDGFLWIGTMSGLDRYDGYSIKIFRSNSQDSTTLNDNNISNLFELPGGKMWVTTSTGPCIYDPATEKFNRNYRDYLNGLSLPLGNVTSIVRDAKDRYWFVYDNLGVYQYNSASRKVIHITSGQVASLKEDSKGLIWLMHQDGLIQKLEAATGKVVLTSGALQKIIPGTFTYEFYIDTEGALWAWTAGSPNGVFLWDAHTNSVRRFVERSQGGQLKNNNITDILQDNQGNIWIATDHGGINLIDKKNNNAVQYLVHDPGNAKSLSQNSIVTLYKDDLGIIWVGTFKQGINYLNERIVKFAHYQHQDAITASLQFDDVNRFVEDKSGNIWIGTNGGGLIYFDRAKNACKQYLHNPANINSISNNVIVSLLIDHEGKLWIGSYYGGLTSFDGRQFVHYKHEDAKPFSLADDRVWEIFEDSKNNLWVGTLNGGLDLMDRKTGRFTHHQNRAGQQGPFQSNYISSILEDRKGNLWVGTALGLTVFENKGQRFGTDYQQYDINKGLSNNNVISLLQDSKGRIWVGTREGLNVFDAEKRTIITFSMKDGLPDNTILNILEDDKGSIWISTPNGLSNLVLNQTVGLDELSFSVLNYDETNNLQGREFNENAALKTRAGELIFGGPNGFNIIDPARLHKFNNNPRIVFTGLQILNNNIEPGEEVNNRVLLEQALPELDRIELKFRENVFTIEFAALDFSHGSRAKYAYQLEGFNDEWIYTDGTQRRATFTNLDPGNYTLKVKVLNSNGTWSQEKSLKIRITPPFWRTPVAYIIYVLIFASILYLARRITVDRAHMRFEVQMQRKEAERMHALDRMKTKFFTNVSHEFRTPLSLIISPLERMLKNSSDQDQKKQLHLVYRNAKRLLNLINQLLDFRKLEVQEFKLHPVAGDIVKFIRDISYSFSDISEKKNINFSFVSDVDDLEIYFDKDKLEKILFNLLSNAYKYTHDNGEVSVRLEYQPAQAQLAIHVCDTGIGIPVDQQEKIFERFFQSDLPETMVNQGSGIGLSITKEFVKLHNGTISVRSQPDKGSCFTVVLPVRKIADPVANAGTNEVPVSLEILEETGNEPVVSSNGNGQVNGPTNGINKKKTILLVEDNEDFRFYLKDNLKPYYHIVEAANGKDGWEKVKSLVPDLVVSDIMMPLMNGIELVRKIKTDTLTAHIPVVLLTAVGNEEVQLEGYDLGIHDYITKPFTFEILAARIRNLLAQQVLLRKKFQKQVEVNPSEVTVTPLDEIFLKQALEAVEKNIGNPDFSVEDLSREMHMSRVALYKKTLALTGKAPLEFIRSIRLKRGAQLLEKSGKTVSEIAYEVGFNNPKNFTKYFKEEFKVLPSQYQGKVG